MRETGSLQEPEGRKTMPRSLHLALAATLIAAPLGGAVAGETFTVFDLAYKGSEQYTGPGGGTKPGDMLVWNSPLLPSTRARRSAPAR
jgi:hypothetical protein